MPDQYDPILAGDTLSDSREKITNRDDATRVDSFGPVEPDIPVAFMTWADTSTNKVKRRNAANNAWIIEGDLVVDNLGHLRRDGTGLMSGNLNFNSNRGINVLDPIGPQDIATKNYHDLNSPGTFIFHSELQFTAGFGVAHSMGFLNVAENIGFNVIGGNTQLSVLNSGLYNVECNVFKNAGQAIGFNFRKINPGPTTTIINMGSSDSGTSSISNSRMLRFVAGDIYDFFAGGNGISANGIVNSNINITFLRP